MKKNVYIFTMFILALSIATFSFELCSSQGKRIPAGKRPLGYNGPTNIRQTPIIVPLSPTKSVDEAKETPMIEQEESTSEDNEAQKAEQSKKETQRISDTQEAQKNIPQLGWFARAYATIAPIILVTMDKAIGTGITESTKNLIDQSLTRWTFINLKNDIIEKAKINVNDKEFNKALKKHNLENTSDEQKFNIAKEMLFAQNGIQNPEKLEKDTSISSIIVHATHIFVLNTVVNVMAAFFGYGTNIGLRALMPESK